MEKEERELLVGKFALKDFNLIGFFTVELLSCSCFEEAKAAKVFKWKGMYFELLHDVLNIWLPIEMKHKMRPDLAKGQKRPCIFADAKSSRGIEDNR